MHKCWQQMWFRGLGYTVTTAVLLLVLVTAAMNWYGGRKWQQTVADMKREGVSLELGALLQDPIPDEVNFCAIPALSGITLEVDGDSGRAEPGEKRAALKDLANCHTGPKGKEPPAIFRGAAFGEPMNMSKWTVHLGKAANIPAEANDDEAARQLLEVLSPQDALVNELATGLSRPGVQWTPSLKARELHSNVFAMRVPHYTVLLPAVRSLCFRSTVAARAGSASKAHEAALLATRMTQATAHEPFAIGLLVASTQATFVFNTTWELCYTHAGSASDFQKLQTELSKIDMASSAALVWERELAGGAQTLRDMKASRDMELVNYVFDFEHPLLNKAAMHLVPTGWFDWNAANSVDLQARFNVLPTRRGELNAISVRNAQLKDLLAASHESPEGLGMLFARVSMPTLGKLHAKFAYAQCLLNQAVIACVLEAFHAENNNYPDSLEGLTLADGTPLPEDIINKVPIGYRKTENGYYRLWCWGWDGRDDDGMRGEDENAAREIKGTPAHTEALKRLRFSDLEYTGDWVWDFPVLVK